MTITTVAINCDVSLANNTEFTASQLEFTLSQPDYDTISNDSVPAATVVLALDASGVATANLWPVDRGTRNTFYRVVLIGTRTINGRATSERFALGNIAPPSTGAPFALADLLGQSTGGIVVGSTIYETLADAVQAALDAADAAAQSAADAQTWTPAYAAEAVADAEAARDRAQAWAESATAPDPLLPASKSAKTWAGEAAADAATADADADRAETARDDAQGVLDDRLRKDVATLLADTTLTYTAAQPGTVVAGDIVRTRAEGFAYQVAASGATDQDVTTAGGVKLYVLSGNQGYNVKAFGAVGDGVADDTAPIQTAFGHSGSYIVIPDGVYIVGSVTGSNLTICGNGVIRKRPATKGNMVALTGNNVVDGVTFDYDWTSAAQTLPYAQNISLRQGQGSVVVRNCKFLRSFTYALYALGASVTITGSNFAEGAQHNNLSSGLERTSYYVAITADLLTDEQFVEITGNTFVGPSLDPADLHLNPTGIYLNAQAVDGVRYKSVNIVGNTLLGCSQNAGGGNVTGAIDSYNGVENLVVSGNTIRFFTYAGVKVQNSSNFAITGNTITDGATPAGAAEAQSFGIISTDRIRGSAIEQTNATIANNVIQNCQYIGISNSCDNVAISGNIIDGVVLNALGDGIRNTGSFVNIVGNICRKVEGTFVVSLSANRVKVIGNTFQSDTVANPAAVQFTGDDIDISHNTFVSSLASVGSGIRTDGPASNIRAIGNYIDGYPRGIDLRTTNGAVNSANVANNQFANISVANLNIVSTVTNASVQMSVLPLVTVTYDPPSLTVGTASPVQTTTVTGAVFGDHVVAAGARDMLGLFVVAWVSAADTISWYVLNPQGNPNGTRDLGSTVFRFRVQKTAT